MSIPTSPPWPSPASPPNPNAEQNSCTLICSISAVYTSWYYSDSSKTTLLAKDVFELIASEDERENVETRVHYIDPKLGYHKTNKIPLTFNKPYRGEQWYQRGKPGTNLRCFSGTVESNPPGYGFTILNGNEAAIEYELSTVYKSSYADVGSQKGSAIYNINIISSDCSPGILNPPAYQQPSLIIFSGTASPPPPTSNKKMNCCDCNTIATIIESRFADNLTNQLKLIESLKDHIDQRIKEEVEIHGKQLEALMIDLQPIIDRINELERNLWNGRQQ